MSFDAIKGQDRPVELLKDYIRQSSLGGGYLFVGPQGLGKRLIAVTLAKAVNCLNQTLDSCDTCASCAKIEAGQHPDVHMIEASGSEIKIEQIRELKKYISLKPYEGRTNVFIIDNAHNLNAESSNALLKILEEPPGNSLIILITDKTSLIFNTIVSRCKILKFSGLARLKLKAMLKKDYRINEQLAHFLAYFSEGRIGFALELKDKDILDKKNRIIDSFTQSQKSRMPNIALQNREEVKDQLNILATWFRDIYLIKTGMPYSEVINLDRKDDLLRLIHRFSFSELDRIFNLLSESVSYLDQNINVRLMLHNLGAQLWKA
ncbi:MAG: DNA polymerase III subunit delta' [Candidatus Omnitrophica bacterium]|nr:DNA polymerase III subunit delta' [Candidatus Omnitrophota bacterium]